jgi:hypothetical protein
MARLSFMVRQLCSWLCSITNKPSRHSNSISWKALSKAAPHLLLQLLAQIDLA